MEALKSFGSLAILAAVMIFLLLSAGCSGGVDKSLGGRAYANARTVEPSFSYDGNHLDDVEMAKK